MQEYISKQQQILRPAEAIYAAVSRFDNLTPAVADRVEEWQADEEHCSFKAKGFTVKLRMEERVEPKHVKMWATRAACPSTSLSGSSCTRSPTPTRACGSCCTPS